MTIRGILLASAVVLPAMMLTSQARAQSNTLVDPPIRLPLDKHGVDLASGAFDPPSSSVSIGGKLGLSFSRVHVFNGWRHNFLITANATSGGTTASVNIGGRHITFTGANGSYTSDEGTGETLNVDFTTNVYTYTAADGTKITFGSLGYNQVGYYGNNTAAATQIVQPDGEIINLNYETESYAVSTSGETVYVYYARLQSVTSNTGYMLKFNYAYNGSLTSSSIADNWQRLTKVTAINTAVEYCDPNADTCSLNDPWPYLAFTNWGLPSTTETITDELGRETSMQIDSSYNITGIRTPSENAAGDTGWGVVIAYGSNGQVSSVTDQPADGSSGPSVVRTYSWTTGTNTLTSVSNDSLGRKRTTVSDTTQDEITSDSNAFGQTTTYSYQSGTGLLLTKTLPDGEKTTYNRDSLNRITSVVKDDQTGANAITTSATYPADCSNMVTCHKPLTTTDAAGNVTTYTYDQTTGDITEVQLPAAASGDPRPTVQYSYASYSAKALNSSGTLVAFSNPVTLLVGSTRCRTAATCSGSADEQVDSVTYDNTVQPNLLPVSRTTELGDGSSVATTAYTYDNLGDVLSIDGPLAGTADTVYKRYDAAGELVGLITPDPDGSGPQPRMAERITYNADGQVTRKETGTVTGTDATAWANFSPDQEVDTSYDLLGRKSIVRHEAPSSTTQYSVVQYSYDAAGRLDCTAVRMNAPLTTTTLPASACTAMTAGSYGPDRITQRVYNALDNVTAINSGVGTSLAQTTEAVGYLTGSSQNDQVSWVEDANGNRTQYLYDAFGRRYETEYPSKTTTHTADSSDTESITFDTYGRVSGYTNREGDVFAFTRDDLNRVIEKVVPARSGLPSTDTRDVYYGYDLFGQLTYARFDSATGEGITNSWNALGELVSSTNNMDSVSRTVSYAYDLAGQRTSITHPDGASFSYAYDPLGRNTTIKDAGGTALVTWGFTNQGRLASRTDEGSAPSIAYGYDNAGRLDSLALTDPGNSAYSVGYTYSYNPANEVTSTGRDNDAYAFGSYTKTGINYTANGLNQYSALDPGTGAISYSYDANGNLTSDGTSSYLYDTENRMVQKTTGSGTVNLRYDPLGRLYEVTDASGSIRRLYYDGTRLVDEYDGSGTLLHSYVHGAGAGDDPLIAFDTSTETYSNAHHLYADRLGSVILETDDTGAKLALNAYDAYGVPGASNAGRFQYTGQAWVPEIGMYYYKARMYSPTLGRFMQTDPTGYASGMNDYAYVMNDPMNFVDPTGLACVVYSYYANVSEPSSSGTIVSTVQKFSETVCYSSGGSDSTPPTPPAGGGNEIVVIAKKPKKAKTKPACGSSGDHVYFTITSIQTVPILGFSYAFGKFDTSSGGKGTFSTGSFNLGLEAGVSVQRGYSPNLDTFRGFSDGISGALGDFSGSLSRSESTGKWSRSGGAGASPPIPELKGGLSGFTSETDITSFICPSGR